MFLLKVFIYLRIIFLFYFRKKNYYYYFIDNELLYVKE